MSDSADFVIVGGGVAGALLADRLGRAGKSVILLEAGSRVVRDEAARKYAAASARTLKAPYEDEHFAFAPFDLPAGTNFKSTYMRRLGGTTWHWQGHTPRMLPADFTLFSLYGVGVDWPIRYEHLESWYCQAEAELGVSGDHAVWNGLFGAFRSQPFPMGPIWPSYGDRRVSEEMQGLTFDGQELHVRSIPQARNSSPYKGRPACAGNSTCIPLCPIGAKYDASTHLDRVEKRRSSKVTVHDLMQAVKLEIVGGKVKQVMAVDGRTMESKPFKGDVVIVCANAIETIRLLMASNYVDESDELGRNLMDHPTGQVVALAPWPVWPFRGPPATSGIDDLRDGDSRSKMAAVKFSLGNDGWGRFQAPEEIVAKRWIGAVGFGEALRKKIEDEGPRLYRISWASEQLPSRDNRLVDTKETDHVGLPKIRIDYSVEDYALDTFPRARTAVRRIFERAKMTDILVDPDPRKFGGSGHILGTCRMGADKTRGVVDSFGRAYAADNLFVVGGATFPTVGTSNPTLTIAALALRTAEHLGGASDVEQ